MDNRELWLAEAMVELADTGSAGFDEAACTRCLAMRLAELLDPAEVAVLIADGSGCLTAAAASTGRALDLASFEGSHGEGPGTRCYRSARSVLNESVTATTARWPRFAAAARAAGFAVVSSLPMRHHEETIGVVSVLGPDGYQVGDPETGLAQVLAEAAAIAILKQRVLRQNARTAEQLRHALDSRVLIEQAKGIVAARLGIAPAAAFEILRRYARRRNRTLIDVACATIRGELPVNDPATAPRARP